MNKRFDLNSLPFCSAKTRNGTPCKRRGNLKNGRCKLHGGNSTGSKTELGKMSAKAHSMSLFPSMYCGERIPDKYYQRAFNAFNKLIQIVKIEPLNWQAIYATVEPDVIPLEMLKYLILELKSIEEFMMIQHVLDAYYSETRAEHLRFTVYQPQWVPFGAQPQLNTPQREFIYQWMKSHPPLDPFPFSHPTRKRNQEQ
ncbi:HGGxSTG domain-containing protein [Photobacterium toruni]|uniref:HGGxSTG domain-containing protein n=1 Tax=Photobacterium toruni TaxID=1935446 RepID=A0ABU6L9Y8_9GAMM|nr:HGGxSTG domain-containing protein [Photobacterium toruni]